MHEGRFLVIGCGSIGKRHLDNLVELGIDDLAAFDAREDRLLEVKDRFKIPVFTDLAAALGQGTEVALVCTPTRFHTEHAMSAAQRGCHLFIEKPLADSLDGTDELLKEIRSRHLITLVGCNFRFDPGMRQVKQLIDQGAIGSVVSARAQFGQYLPDWHPWEDYRSTYSAQAALGGGVILDRIHEIDYLRWLLGEVKEVYAMADRLSRLEIDTEDTAEILLRFESGTIGSVHLDYVRRGYDCRLEVVGDAGTIEWNYEQHRVTCDAVGESSPQTIELQQYDSNTMYLEEMRHFLQALRHKEKPELDAFEARRVLAIALAAKQSARTGTTLAV